MLQFNIRNQEISRIDNFSPAEKSVEYLTAKFNFKTEDWNGATKRAIFRNVKSKVEKDAMLEDDSCIVPWEVLEGSSDIEVSVHGVIGTKDITTDVAVFNLNRTLSGGSASQEPSPTVYEQMVEMVKDAKEIAQSVRNDADEGKFVGSQGPAGKDGKDGKDGDNGKSAYEYAVIGGYQGTEAEFMESLARAGDVITKEEHEAELLKAMVKVTTEEAPFHHITDSANMKVVDFGMRGKTEQPTTEGKNLFYKTNEYRATYDISLPAGTIITCSAEADYTGSVDLIYTDDSAYAYGMSLTTGNRKHGDAYTLPKDIKQIRFRLTAVEPQVEIGNLTDYEPFTNGPSPNPEYPQEIQLAGVYNEETGRWEHKCVVGNKNEFDESKLYKGEFVEFNGVRCYKYRDTGAHFIYDGTFQSDIQYTITLKAYRENGITSPIMINFEFTDGTKDTTSLLVDTLKVYTTPANKSLKTIRGEINYNANVYLDLSVMQIGRGSTVTELVPHASQPFTLTSDRPLTMWDNLVKVDGKWYWDYKQLKLVVDSLDKNVTMSDDFKGCYFSLKELPVSNYRDGYCNQLINDMNVNDKRPNIMWLGRNNNYLYVLNSTFYDDTLEDKGLANWKAHLNENPLEIWTYSDTSELVPLLDEEQELLHNLEMYYGVTNVYNEQGCPIKITYAADQELHWNQKLLQIQQAII